MAHMFNVWLQVTDPKTFFLQMQKSFSVAQLISGFMLYFNESKLEWLVNFFNDNEDLIQTNHGNAKTIGIYYTRYFSGGIEKFLSMIMPIYISMNYNVVFFTDMINESEEYPPLFRLKMLYLQGLFLKLHLMTFCQGLKNSNIT